MNHPAMGAGARAPRILLLESDSRARSLLEYGLGRQGFEVICVSSPDEAQKRLSAAPVQPTVMVAEATARPALRTGADALPLPLILLARKGEQIPEGGLALDEFVRIPIYVRDVVALAQLKLKPRSRDGAFDVLTDTLPLTDLVRALLAGGRSGRLTLAKGAGGLTFAGGRVVQAAFGPHRDQEALVRLLLFAHGSYEVSFGPVLAESELSLDGRALCEEILPRVRHFQAAAEDLVPDDERLAVDFRALAFVFPSLPVGVGPLLRLCDGRRSVGEIIVASRLDELVLLRLLTRFKELGVLVPYPGPIAEQPLLGFSRELPVLRQLPPTPPAARPRPAPFPLQGWLLLASVVGILGVGLGMATRPPAVAVAMAPAPMSALPQIILQPDDTPRFSPRLAYAAELYRQGRVNHAAHILDEVVSSYPRSAAAWVLLGLARFDAGDMRGAREAAERTLALDPLEGRAYLLKASVALASKDRVSARAALRRYREIDPDGPYVHEANQLLSSLDEPQAPAP